MKLASDKTLNPTLGALDHMLVLLDCARELHHSRDFVAIALLVRESEVFITDWIAAQSF